MILTKRAASALAGGAAALLLLVASLRSPAPPTKERPAPSGRVYRVMGAGPVPLGAGGARGLGVEYLADSLSDRARLDRDAEELMTLMSRDADVGGFSAIVVTAYHPRAIPIPRRGASKTAVFARGADGIWRRAYGSADKPAPPEAADLRALDDSYARIERAVTAKDLDELKAVQAPDFWHRLNDGSARGREEENAALAKSLAAVGPLSAELRVSSMTVAGAQAVVVASMTSTGTFVQDGRRRRFRSVTISRDTWVKSPDGWRLSLSADLDDRFELLGR